MYYIVSIILGVVMLYLTYRLLKARPIVSAGRQYVDVQDRITIVSSREEAVKLLALINDCAQAGDIVFGHCRLGVEYPTEAYSSASRAVSRGVKFQVIIPERPETMELRQFWLGLNPEYVQVKKPTEDLYASVYGIRGKQVLVVSHMADRSVGIHYKEPVTTKYVEIAFDSVWEDRAR